MKKLFIILLCILSGSRIIPGQEEADRIDSVSAARDSAISLPAPVITKPLPVLDSVISKTAKAQQDTIISVTKTEPEILPQEYSGLLDKFTKLNIIALAEIFFLFLLGVFLVKLIDFITNKFFGKLTVSFIRTSSALLKISLWIIIIYIVIKQSVIYPEYFLLYIILLSILVFSIAAIPFLKSIVGGYYLTVNMPFRKGDLISAGEFSGEVSESNMRITVLKTESGNVISIPNSFFLSNPVKNINRNEKEFLVDYQFEIPVDFDPEEIISLIFQTAISAPYTFVHSKPSVTLMKSDYSRGLRIYEISVYITDSSYDREMRSYLNKEIDSAIQKLKSGNSL